jgi:hypothetical protein
VNRVRLARRRLGAVRGTVFRITVTVNEAIRAPGRATSRTALRELLRKHPYATLSAQ